MVIDDQNTYTSKISSRLKTSSPKIAKKLPQNVETFNNFLKTKIESKVLIGSNSTILPVKIESETVIGAGSVVTKNCLKKKIYAGNPAKLIKK